MYWADQFKISLAIPASFTNSSSPSEQQNIELLMVEIPRTTAMRHEKKDYPVPVYWSLNHESHYLWQSLRWKVGITPTWKNPRVVGWCIQGKMSTACYQRNHYETYMDLYGQYNPKQLLFTAHHPYRPYTSKPSSSHTWQILARRCLESLRTFSRDA